LRSSRKADALVFLALLLLPLLWFAPQALGNKTLLPADNLFQYPPWQSYSEELGVGIPYNALISDLVLENLQWKSLIVDALAAGKPADILWNPRSFAGVPFFAAGQQSAAYPLSLLFYIMPLWRAYGVFTWLQIGLAAVCMYLFMRVLRAGRMAAFLAGIAYAFSGFFIVSVNFTMVIAAAAWLPLLLACIEMVVRKLEEGGASNFLPVPYVALGAVVLAIQILAGHVEITYYTLMVMGLFALWRLAAVLRRLRSWRPVVRGGAWLLIMVSLGVALGGVQILPLYELVRQSFREGSATLQQVRDWAWPSRQIITFLLPDFYGNPTHHAYYDIWQRAIVPVTQNALGQPLTTIDWGVKNYVEGGNYLGIATLVLAITGVLAGVGGYTKSRGQTASRPEARPAGGDSLPAHAAGCDRRTVRPAHVGFFAILAVLSLLFAFGTPLYAILYYGLPGYSQLHSAFRWVFPYTLSMAALAGFGLDWLLSQRAARKEEGQRKKEGLASAPWRLARLLAWLSVVAGAGALLLFVLSVLRPDPFIALGERLLNWGFWSDLAQSRGFSDGAMLWSYEAVQIARFGAMALLTGLGLLWLMRPAEATAGRRGSGARQVFLAGMPLVLVLLLDVWLAGRGFNPAADSKLLQFTPRAIEFLQSQLDPAQPWRLTSFDGPDEKVLNANSAMRYGLEDVRGYDSIIPRQYVEYMRRLHPQGELLYNRIAAIYSQLGDQPNHGALDSPLLDLLGVRYVVSTQPIPNDGYALVYDQEVKVYENTGAFPRAFVVPQAISATNQAEALDRLQQVDPGQVVVIEGLPDDQIPPAASPQVREARFSERGNREYFIDVNVSDQGWLVVTDNYFDGWKAYLRPFGVEGEGVTAGGESVEQQLTLYRADGAFRAVYLPQAGQWTVRFVYSPRSMLLGVYVTFLAGVTLLLLAGWWAWKRYYKGEGSEVGTVAKNSAVQVVMSLFNRGIDFAFAMLRLRVLSPEGEGSYVFAITFYMIAEIVTRFGLGTLLTRDVAFERGRARRYLTNVVTLRSLLWIISLPVMALALLLFQRSPTPLTNFEIQAVGLFAAALFFANIADALSSVFMAFEKMEYPAASATAVTVAKVALSALVLLPPFNLGFVGLAGVAVLMNVVQVIWLWILLERKVLGPAEEATKRETISARHLDGHPGGQPEAAISARHFESAGHLDGRQSGRIDWALQRYMLRESGPLMLNHLLATVFWRISQLVLRGAINPAAVGIFSAGIKYIDGLNVIPAYFTAAIFPLMSRYAHAGSDSLVKAYRLALQLLFMAALPIAVFFTFAATPLIQILGGAAYLPDSAIALRVMIWSIPIGFINSVTQYVLIAVHKQRFLTGAFLIGVLFAAISNWVLVPKYGAIAAAALLIPAELSLFFPFAWAVHRYVAPMPWLALLGRPLLATVVNLVIVWGLERMGVPLLLALLAGFIAYCAVLFVLRSFNGEEFAVLRSYAERRLRRPAREAAT